MRLELSRLRTQSITIEHTPRRSSYLSSHDNCWRQARLGMGEEDCGPHKRHDGQTCHPRKSHADRKTQPITGI